MQSVVVKIIISCTFIVILFFCCRLNFFSEKLYDISNVVVPIKIPLIDSKDFLIPILLSYEIENQYGTKEAGKLGGCYHSGDNVTFSLQVGIDCYASFIGFDSNRLFNWKENSDSIEKTYHLLSGNIYNVHFPLDSTIGTEVYYIIASNYKIDYRKFIQPEIKRIRELQTKGPATSRFEISLKKGFNYRYIYFNHF